MAPFTLRHTVSPDRKYTIEESNGSTASAQAGGPDG
jgi:hypothetical protein